MDLWYTFVLATVKQAPDGGDDRLKELMDEHRTLRQMLGGADEIDAPTCGLQTIVDNVGLLCAEINAVEVAHGHAKLQHTPEMPLQVRVDLAFTKTAVHWDHLDSLRQHWVRDIADVGGQLYQPERPWKIAEVFEKHNAGGHSINCRSSSELKPEVTKFCGRPRLINGRDHAVAGADQDFVQDRIEIKA